MMKMADVPCESHEPTRYVKLVWFLAPHPENKYPYYAAQLWSEDHVEPKDVQLRVPVRTINLIGDEQYMTLEQLVQKYPAPEHFNGQD